MSAPTVWMDVQDAAEAAEVVASAEIAEPTLAVGSGVQDCADAQGDEDVNFLRAEDMLEGDMSSVPKGPRSRPIPTAVMQAIQEGYPLGHPGMIPGNPTMLGIAAAAPQSEIDDEKSVPTDLKPHDEVVYRIRKLEAGHVEIGRAIGQLSSDVRTGFAELTGEMNERLGSLVTFADLAEKRASAKELAESNARAAIAAAEIAAKATQETAVVNATAAASAARVESERARTIESGHNADITKARLSSREKIQLAIIGLISTALAAYFAMNHVTIK